MPILDDIPAPFYVQIPIKLYRFARKTSLGQKAARKVRNRLLLGTMTKAHIHAMHAIRTLAFEEDLHDGSESFQSSHFYNQIANACAISMGEVLDLGDESCLDMDLYCTIKALSDLDSPTTNGEEDEKNWMAYTLGRSDCNDDSRLEFGRENGHSISGNTSFAPMLGISDGITDWGERAYSCFHVNDLNQCHEKYVCTKDGFENQYVSTIVFPLRYKSPQEDSFKLFGFLTFDSKTEGMFEGMPDIFEYSRDEYEKKASFSSAYHLGGLMADALATAFMHMELSTREKD